MGVGGGGWVDVCVCGWVDGGVCVCVNMCKAQTSNTKIELAALHTNQIETPTLRNHKQNMASMITSSSNHKKPNRKTPPHTHTHTHGHPPPPPNTHTHIHSHPHSYPTAVK